MHAAATLSAPVSPALSVDYSECWSDLEMEFRPYQQRIATKAVSMFTGSYVNRLGQVDRPVSSVLIESPTGSGKTVMGLMIARWMQQNLGYRIGWVAMRRNLLTQAAEENLQRGFGIEMQCISMFDRKPPEVDMLVVDEAQHDAARSMADLHCTVKPKAILGLTATPFRTDRVKLCFEKVIKDAGIHRLIQDGYLAPYAHYTVPEYTPQKVAECYLREPQRWGKTLMFFHRHHECLLCRNALARQGVKVEVITSRSQRESQLAAFEQGKVDVLISMAILTEGFDCPSLRTVFCRPSGRSCTIQMAGRVLRKCAAESLKQIVQCRKTKHPMLRTAAPAEQYTWMENNWRTLTLNPQLESVGRAALQVIASSQVQLPKALLNKRPAQRRWRTGFSGDGTQVTEAGVIGHG